MNVIFADFYGREVIPCLFCNHLLLDLFSAMMYNYIINIYLKGTA